MSEEEEDIFIGNKTWFKMAGSAEKEGFREGSAAGRDQAFQKGFDIGYKTGFSSGHQLGLINGVLRVLSENEDFKSHIKEGNINKVEPFHKPSKGQCIICPPSDSPLTKEQIAASIIPSSQTMQEVVSQQQLAIQELKNKKVGQLAPTLKRLDLILPC